MHGSIHVLDTTACSATAVNYECKIFKYCSIFAPIIRMSIFITLQFYKIWGWEKWYSERKESPGNTN